MEKSTTTFLVLVIVLSICAAAAVYLQGNSLASELPAPIPILAFANSLMILALYGSLGFIGLKLSKRIGFPEIWDKKVTTRERFLTPLAIGFVLGLVLIASDIFLSSFNSIGRLPHPSFPTSVVASVSAGIGEEIIFRLFLISLFVWLVSKVLSHEKHRNVLFGVASLISAVLFSVAHLPTVMLLLGINSLSDLSAVLVGEIIGLNSMISLFAAYYFRKYGFLAPVGIHFWTDVVWHVVYGGL